MNKIYRFGSLLLIFALVASLFQVTGAHAVDLTDTTTLMTDTQIARIEQNCTQAQETLSQIHANDALLRVNQGQIYEEIGSGLMTPMNSRIVLNHLDGGDLVTTAALYEQELTKFRTDYNTYEVSLSSVITMKCQKQPIAFYDAVGIARVNRELLHADVVQLQNLVNNYETDFTNFTKVNPNGGTQS